MRRSALHVLAVSVLLGALSCTASMQARYVKEQENLMLRGSDQDKPPDYSPPSKLFRIAVIDFVDQTHNTAGKVEDMFADVMTTALYKTSRFTLYDRSQLKRKNVEGGKTEVTQQSAPLNSRQVSASDQDMNKKGEVTRTEIADNGGRKGDENQAEDQMDRLSPEVDGVFTGFITNAELSESSNHGTYTIDYRIVKRVPRFVGDKTTLVIFADSANVGFVGNPMAKDKDSKPVSLNRRDIELIANKVKEFFPNREAPEFASAKVTDINGSKVSISLGKKLVKTGYSFFVTTEPDETTGEFAYKGNFVVRDAFDKASSADLVGPVKRDGTPDDRYMRLIKVGDRVLLK